MAFAEYVREAVCAPLALGSTRRAIRDPGCTRRSTTCSRSAASCSSRGSSPTRRATRWSRVQFPGLSGVLPDHGRFDPLDWGLGVQLNTRPPSWMGTRTSPRTFGHFGGPARSSGSIRSLASSARRSRRASSTSGRRRRGRASPTRCSERALAVGAESGVGSVRPRAVVGEQRADELVEVASSQLATTHGVIAVTVAVRGTFMVSATSPKNSPAFRMRRSPSADCETPATPTGGRRSDRPGSPSRMRTVPGESPPRARIRSASLPSVSPGRSAKRPMRASSVTEAGTCRGDTARRYRCLSTQLTPRRRRFALAPRSLPQDSVAQTHRRAGMPALQLGEGEGEASNETCRESFLSGYAPKGKSRVALRLRSRTSARARTSAARRRPRRPARRP